MIERLYGDVENFFDHCASRSYLILHVESDSASKLAKIKSEKTLVGIRLNSCVEHTAIPLNVMRKNVALGRNTRAVVQGHYEKKPCLGDN